MTTPEPPEPDVPSGDGPEAGSKPWHRPMPGWVAPTATLLRDSTESLRDPHVLLGLLLIFSVVTRLIWLDLPKRGTIFDEAYYVNSARVILGIDVPEGGKYGDRPSPRPQHRASPARASC